MTIYCNIATSGGGVNNRVKSLGIIYYFNKRMRLIRLTASSRNQTYNTVQYIYIYKRNKIHLQQTKIKWKTDNMDFYRFLQMLHQVYGSHDPSDFRALRGTYFVLSLNVTIPSEYNIRTQQGFLELENISDGAHFSGYIL